MSDRGVASTQLILQQQYRLLKQLLPRTALPAFSEVGFREYSQFEEDGILLYLFSLIPPKTRVCLEICAGDGIECNTANLIINHGWWGYLFDGNSENVQRGTEFYATNKETWLHPPRFECAWITAENVNSLVQNCGAVGEIDLLSLDLDGMDYWIWKALDVVEPRIVVCEVHNPIPPSEALTIPYDPDYRLPSMEDDFRGASLAAMVKLGHSKGYRLIGTHRFGFNAFFVKRGIAEDLLPERTAEDCATDPYTIAAQQTRWPKVRDRNWVRV